MSAGGKKCAACGGSYRTSVLAYVPKAGRLVRARVCPACAKGAARVVLTSAAPACACGRSATVCVECQATRSQRAARDAADAKPRARALHQRATLYRMTGDNGEYSVGLADGIDMAANYLTGGEWATIDRARKPVTAAKGGA